MPRDQGVKIFENQALEVKIFDDQEVIADNREEIKKPFQDFILSLNSLKMLQNSSRYYHSTSAERNLAGYLARPDLATFLIETKRS